MKQFVATLYYLNSSEICFFLAKFSIYEECYQEHAIKGDYFPPDPINQDLGEEEGI